MVGNANSLFLEVGWEAVSELVKKVGNIVPNVAVGNFDLAISRFRDDVVTSVTSVQSNAGNIAGKQASAGSHSSHSFVKCSLKDKQNSLDRKKILKKLKRRSLNGLLGKGKGGGSNKNYSGGGIKNNIRRVAVMRLLVAVWG